MPDSDMLSTIKRLNPQVRLTAGTGCIHPTNTPPARPSLYLLTPPPRNTAISILVMMLVFFEYVSGCKGNEGRGISTNLRVGFMGWMEIY